MKIWPRRARYWVHTELLPGSKRSCLAWYSVFCSDCKIYLLTRVLLEFRYNIFIRQTRSLKSWLLHVPVSLFCFYVLLLCTSRRKCYVLLYNEFPSLFRTSRKNRMIPFKWTIFYKSYCKMISWFRLNSFMCQLCITFLCAENGKLCILVF